MVFWLGPGDSISSPCAATSVNWQPDRLRQTNKHDNQTGRNNWRFLRPSHLWTYCNSTGLHRLRTSQSVRLLVLRLTFKSWQMLNHLWGSRRLMIGQECPQMNYISLRVQLKVQWLMTCECIIPRAQTSKMWRAMEKQKTPRLSRGSDTFRLYHALRHISGKAVHWFDSPV